MPVKYRNTNARYGMTPGEERLTGGYWSTTHAAGGEMGDVIMSASTGSVGIVMGVDKGFARKLARQGLSGPEVQKVLTRAVDKVAVSARAQILDVLAGQIAVTKTELRNRNVLYKRPRYEYPEAVITITGRRIPLARLGARETKDGVTYQIRRGGARVLATGAFMATVGNGHVGVFQRRGDPRQGIRVFARGGQRMVRPRLPIREMYGPSVPTLVEDAPELADQIFLDQIAERLEAEIDQQVTVIYEQRLSG